MTAKKMGRPFSEGPTKKVIIQIRCTVEEREEIRRVAELNNMTVSQLIREAVKKMQ